MLHYVITLRSHNHTNVITSHHIVIFGKTITHHITPHSGFWVLFRTLLEPGFGGFEAEYGPESGVQKSWLESHGPKVNVSNVVNDS